MQDRFSPRPACGERGRGEGQAPQSLPVLSMSNRKLAGGSPAASYFSCFAKKSNQKKANPLRWPSASRSRQAQAGQCGNLLCLDFEGSEARTSALLSGLSLPSAAASEGGRQPARLISLPSPRLRGEGGPKGRVSGQVLNLNPPLCRRGRMTELGEVEASVFEHVAAKQIVRVCEPPNSAIRPRLARRAAQRGALFFRPFLLGKQKKGASRRAAPGKESLKCGSALDD